MASEAYQPISLSHFSLMWKECEWREDLEFVFTDITALVLIAAVLIIVYIIGTYWKHRTLTKYAHWFEEKLSSKGRVKFASHGHAGLRIKCETAGSGGTVREVHFALTLGARENLLYYPYALFAKDSDKLSCWAVIHKPIQSNLKILKRSHKKRTDDTESSSLAEVDSDWLKELGYLMYASDRNYALDLVSKASLSDKLRTSKDLESIELDRLSSRLHVTAKLRTESLPDMVDLMFALANSA